MRARVILNLRFRAVQKKIKDGKNRGLYRVAGLIRTSAKRSMRLRPGPSRAGSPPHAHTRAGLRQIMFHVDQNQSAALVGPVKFSRYNSLSEPVPHVQEFGGTFLSVRKPKTYPERSYMGHTLKKLHREGKIPRQFVVSMGRIL